MVHAPTEKEKEKGKEKERDEKRDPKGMLVGEGETR